MMQKTLFVSDMDGTLLDNDAQISATTARILSRLCHEGVPFTVATARTPATVEPLLAHTFTTLPCIVMTGAALWHRDTQTYSHVHYIPADHEEAIDEAFSRAGVTPLIYTLPDDHIIRVYHAGKTLNAAEQKFVDDRNHLPLKRFCLNATPPANAHGRRILMFAMGTIPGVEQAATDLRRVTNCSISCYRDTYNPALGLLEVFAPDVSKAQAVLGLKESIGAQNLVVYGDNLNDLPMLAAADMAVAVENALPAVKEAADKIIGPNSADAVARNIEQLTHNQTL